MNENEIKKNSYFSKLLVANVKRWVVIENERRSLEDL